MHMPQNILAETELRHLAAIPYQIISPASNSPIIGIYQDSLLGSFRFTRKNVTMSTRDAMNLLMMFPRVNVDGLRKKGNKMTSFEVLSQIFPPMTIVGKSKLWEEGEDFATSNNVLEIRNGNYVRGQLDKSSLGSSTKGILHRVCNDFGNMACSNFNDDLQNIVTEYMKSSSFSVGISDLVSDKNTQTEIIKIIKDQKEQVQILIDKVHLGVFENNTAKSNLVEFETMVNNTLNTATEKSGKIGRKSLSKDNRFLMIVESGSKGSLINISQMVSCLGQQNVDGKRIPYGFDSRTLPHFNKFDDSPNARGFIENSYISGLTAPELFFHAMGGRIGLIDTAVKSVVKETPIIIIENNIPKYVKIGEWIDSQLEISKEQVQHFPKDRRLEMLNIKNEVYIPTTDYDGNVTWGEVTAITRHDPGTELYEFKTMGGRSVIVSEAKSMLIWKDERFQEINSPEIVIGDFVPVTANLCKPPITVTEVDMIEYFPKNEYVHGTEFLKAVDMMNKAMTGRSKIPTGWWNEHNGKSFVLPYTKKSSLTRTINRSNINNIKDGYIYPYHATRDHVLIPDNFVLNNENGIFIGLFLAEGHARIKSGEVNITNNDTNVQTFVKNWFDKMNINNTLKVKTTKMGTSSTVVGKSALLAQFLHKFVGHLAYNKHVPDVAFVAPEEFIIGILNGYFSGDGTIGKNSIECCSASPRLIEGISMLCSRLSIFGKIFTTQMKKNNFGTKNIAPSHRLSIRSQWAKTFYEKITLLIESKNEKLQIMTYSSGHKNFKTKNDVVFDKIVEINILGIENHPKLYDLSVPSTLNFGIANGLNLFDTSQTGYIQRRLIKGLEDLKIEYDMTVRNSKGKIIQFSYGDDGFDSTKVENQFLPLVGMSIEDIYVHYDIPGITQEDYLDKATIFTKGAVSRMRKQREKTIEKSKFYINRMIYDRDNVVKRVFKFKNENGVRMPVAFQNIISNIHGQLGLSSSSSVDITPLEAFELIEEYFAKMNTIHYMKTNPLFEIMYYFYMNPRDLLVLKRFHRKGLILLLETILLKFKEAIVHPGEMVGVIAGQSVGEPTTQLTLNSVTFETLLLVRNVDTGEMEKVQIGEFTKEHIEKSKKIDYMADKDMTYAELSKYYEVPCATESGDVVWRRIEAVTKHPVINEDGTNTMLKVTTKGNREVIATKAKSFLQLIDGKIQGVNGKDLKVGDYLPVSRKALDYIKTSVLDLKQILHPSKYIYTSEIDKAKMVVN